MLIMISDDSECSVATDLGVMRSIATSLLQRETQQPQRDHVMCYVSYNLVNSMKNVICNR